MDTGTIVIIVILVILAWYFFKKKKNESVEDHRAEIVEEEEFHAKIASLGPVDILCSHVPPSLSELSYDTVARRDEVGSPALLAYIKEYQPKWVFFGHVHNPLKQRLTLNTSQLINIGYFRQHKQIYSLKFND